MHTSPRLISQQELIIYPEFLWGGKKSHLSGAIFSFSFIIFAFFVIFTKGGEATRIGWIAVLAFSILLCTYLLQLTWGPILIMNEHTISIRSNPFLPRIALQWSEIASLTLFLGKRDFYIGITLVPDQLTPFLQRQSPLHQKILTARLNRTHQIASLPQRLVRPSLRSLLETIQRRYRTQIQQHHILMEM